MTTETKIRCPFCGEKFTVVVDCSEDQQTYIEDCFVCCRPIELRTHCLEGELVSVDVTRS